MKQHKHIKKIDTTLIIASTLSIIILLGYTTPNVISPINNYETKETTILFNIEKADYILIDDNKEFTTPTTYKATTGTTIHLTPGTYYWKAKGTTTTKTKTLTIQSEVSLSLEETKEGYDIINNGNEELQVKIYDNNKTTTETITLKPGNRIPQEKEYYEGGKT